MEFELIKDVFDHHCDHLVFDRNLASKLISYHLDFVNKTHDHTLFFGGHVLGVYDVSFTDEDREDWFVYILGVDEMVLRPDLLRIPAVRAEFKISSDTFNLSVIWLLYRLHNEKRLEDKIKFEAMVTSAAILHYKLLTSILNWYFKYNTTLGKAEATYARLNGKFDIKKYNTYGAMYRAKSETMVNGNWHYHSVLESMSSNFRVIECLNNLQGGIRDMMKNVYSVFMQVHVDGDKIGSTNMMFEHDGSTLIKDKLDLSSTYGRYMKSILSDRNSFIKEELVLVILSLIPNMPERLFRLSLEETSKMYYGHGTKEIDHILEQTLIHAYVYLSDNKAILTSGNLDLADILIRLKGVYTSGRVMDPVLINLRIDTEKFIPKVIHNKISVNVSSVRTGFLLYLIARAFTMRHYSTIL